MFMVQNLPKQQPDSSLNPNAHYYFRDKLKNTTNLSTYGQEMRRHATILGGDGPEYTLRKYVIANTFSYSMQTEFHSFEMCQFRIQQERVALPTLP